MHSLSPQDAKIVPRSCKVKGFQSVSQGVPNLGRPPAQGRLVRLRS